MTEQSKRTVQFGIALALIGLIGVVYIWYIWGRGVEQDEAAAQKALNSEISDLNQQIEEARTRMPQIRQEIEEKQEFLARASQRLPSTPDAEGFLESLSDMLEKSGANIQFVHNEPIKEISTYIEIPWKIQAMAQYVEFGVFLNLVEQNPERLMRVKMFDITNNPDLPGYHEVDVDIATFMFNQ